MQNFVGEADLLQISLLSFIDDILNLIRRESYRVNCKFIIVYQVRQHALTFAGLLKSSGKAPP